MQRTENSQGPQLTREQAREAAIRASAVFDHPPNAARLLQAQAQAAGDIGKFFMLCIPVVTEMIGTVISEYGFEATQAGAMAFSAELQKHKDDPQIAQAANELKMKFMPNMGGRPISTGVSDESAD